MPVVRPVFPVGRHDSIQHDRHALCCNTCGGCGRKVERGSAPGRWTARLAPSRKYTSSWKARRPGDIGSKKGAGLFPVYGTRLRSQRHTALPTSGCASAGTCLGVLRSGCALTLLLLMPCSRKKQAASFMPPKPVTATKSAADKPERPLSWKAPPVRLLARWKFPSRLKVFLFPAPMPSSRRPSSWTTWSPAWV